MTTTQIAFLVAGVGALAVGITLGAPHAVKAASDLGPKRTHLAIVCAGGPIWESLTWNQPQKTHTEWRVQAAKQRFTVPQPPSCIAVIEPAPRTATEDVIVWHPEREHATASVSVKPAPKKAK